MTSVIEIEDSDLNTGSDMEVKFSDVPQYDSEIESAFGYQILSDDDNNKDILDLTCLTPQAKR